LTIKAWSTLTTSPGTVGAVFPGEERHPGDSSPPYSPDLALVDFFLFLMLKKELSGLTMTLMEFKIM
jgi:hypothetical protein